MPTPDSADQLADSNRRRFVLFRVLFNARFYYPVLAVLFLDLGLSATQYTLLNFAWAVAIVTMEVPSGVLADRVGRRPLVVLAAGLMVAEMLLLCLAPRGGGGWLFACCLLNRVLSGTAEAMASGADEALCYDSLAAAGREKEWPDVLAQVMRWQGIGFVVAMLAGGAAYDPALLNRVLGTHLDPAMTLRFPLWLTLGTAVMALVTVLGMREPPVAPSDGPAVTALSHLRAAAGWVAHTPLALFAILAGMALDGVTRLFMTFSSTYFRLIDLPAASWGLIGAGMGAAGLVVGPVAKRMVERLEPATNFALVGVVTLIGLAGVALRWPRWGVVWVVPLGLAMSAGGYLVSHYLNAATDSRRRATVLSLRGLAFNLGYGLVSLAFAAALRALAGSNEDETFGRTLPWMPAWTALALAAVAAGFWRWRARLARAA